MRMRRGLSFLLPVWYFWSLLIVYISFADRYPFSAEMEKIGWDPESTVHDIYLASVMVQYDSSKILFLFCWTTNLNKKLSGFAFFISNLKQNLSFHIWKGEWYKEQALPQLLNSVMFPSGWWKEIELGKNVCLSMIASYTERTKQDTN